jgi:UDP-glucose 4-epimerase
MKTAIITGASGFLGKRLTEFLSSNNIMVYALIYNASEAEEFSDQKNVKKIPFTLASMEDIKDLLPYDADVFYHFAWDGVGSNKKNDYSLQMKNVDYAFETIRFVHSIRCRKIIFTGSVSEYAYCKTAITGLDCPSPADAYSAAKIAAHYLCDIYARQNNLDFNWLLISSVYGPGRDDNNLITYTIKTLLNGERPSFTKLEQIWDYIYIDDLINALFLIGNSPVKNCVYPLGSGRYRPLYEYIKIIRDKINPQLSIGIGDLPYKTKDVDNSIVDISLLVQNTGFRPKVSFEEGINITIDFFKKKTEG